MKLTEKYISRIDQLLSLADQSLKYIQTHGNKKDWLVDANFVSSSLSFIESIFGNDHIHYSMFTRGVAGGGWIINLEYQKGILNSIKAEIEGGWILSLKGILTADIFSDFLEMAEHLLSQGYKDAAAVMIGSVLEEHLRQLCAKNAIPIISVKDVKQIPIKANVLNSELTKAQVYNKLEEKSVLAWLGLRNSAAHGKYGEYDQRQIELMLQGVLDFISRNKI